MAKQHRSAPILDHDAFVTHLEDFQHTLRIQLAGARNDYDSDFWNVYIMDTLDAPMRRTGWHAAK